MKSPKKDDDWKGRMIELNKGEEMHIIDEPKFEKGDIVQHRISKKNAIVIEYNYKSKQYLVSDDLTNLFYCYEIELEKVEPEITLRVNPKVKRFQGQCSKCTKGFDIWMEDIQEGDKIICAGCDQEIILIELKTEDD